MIRISSWRYAIAACLVLALGLLTAEQAFAAPSNTPGTSASILRARPTSAQAAPAPAEVSPAPADSSQLITVNSASATSSYATLSAWQRNADGSWTRVFGPMAARVGSAGIGQATEGSDHTPAGDWPLTVAFGRLADPGTAMPYFQTDLLDWWDENPASPTYNLHVRQSASPGAASENLYATGTAYNYAVNIGYNLARVPGAGSAFFLHVGTGNATAGCVSIDQGSLVSIMQWLDPAKNPTIYMRVGSEWTPNPVIPAPYQKIPGPQANAIVFALYVSILGRVPDAAGAYYHSAALQAGRETPAIAAFKLVNSVEHGRQMVNSVYVRCLGRNPDMAGLASHVTALQAGGTVTDLFVAVCASNEAWNHDRDNATQFVRTAYLAILRRPMEATSMWVARVATRGIVSVVRSIAESNEYDIRALDSIYQAMLGRSADTAGIDGYARQMSGRGSFTQPVRIAGSSEFFAKYTGA